MTANDFYEDDEPVEELLAAFDAAEERGVTGRHACRVICDDDGNPIARVRVAADATDEEMRAVRSLVEAAIRYAAEKDAADPEAAAERAARQKAAIARVRARAGLRGEG